MRPASSRDFPPIAVTKREAKRISGLGMTTLDKLRKAGRIKSVDIPGVDRALIDYASLRQLLAGKA